MNISKNLHSLHFRINFLLLFCLIFFTAANVFPQNSDAKLSALRKQFAIKYLQPESHFALAQYYLDKGNQVQAFFILEYARRYRFEREIFDAAFVKFFGDNSPEPSVEAKKAFEEGFALIKQGKNAEAEKLLIESARLAPKSGFIHGWVGRYFYKVKLDNAQALNYYFKTYFLDPHAYETEYVESRLSKIIIENANARFAEMIKSGKSLTEISADPNPVIAGSGIEEMAKQWKKQYVKPLLECLSSDDSGIRWMALTVLLKNADASFDETLTSLTIDADLRKRGLAAYALVNRRKEKSFDILRKMLTDEAELIRFDAISALVLNGGNAELEIVKAHRKNEINPTLREMIDKTLQNK